MARRKTVLVEAAVIARALDVIQGEYGNTALTAELEAVLAKVSPHPRDRSMRGIE